MMEVGMMNKTHISWWFLMFTVEEVLDEADRRAIILEEPLYVPIAP